MNGEFLLPKLIVFTLIFGIFGLLGAHLRAASIVCIGRQKQHRTSGFNTAAVDLLALDILSASLKMHLISQTA